MKRKRARKGMNYAELIAYTFIELKGLPSSSLPKIAIAMLAATKAQGEPVAPLLERVPPEHARLWQQASRTDPVGTLAMLESPDMDKKTIIAKVVERFIRQEK